MSDKNTGKTTQDTSTEDKGAQTQQQSGKKVSSGSTDKGSQTGTDTQTKTN